MRAALGRQRVAPPERREEVVVAEDDQERGRVEEVPQQEGKRDREPHGGEQAAAPVGQSESQRRDQQTSPSARTANW
jgi:hypothetical protein